MRLINIGSLNIDKVYQVRHFLLPGETASSLSYQEHVGGKGLNQSVAAAHAGLQVVHAGKIGQEGEMLTDFLQKAGVDVSKVKVAPDCASGHTIIQIDSQGQNCILLYGGANKAHSEADIDDWLADCAPDDILLLQNETNCVGQAMEKAREKGMRIVFNPSPITDSLREADLSAVDLLLLNEVEGEMLTGRKEPEEILTELERKYPDMEIVLTLGGDGSRYAGRGERAACEAVRAEEVVDTTAAGDTYTGYYISGWARGDSPIDCMKRASTAAAITVSRAGAAPSIPKAAEVDG